MGIALDFTPKPLILGGDKYQHLAEDQRPKIMLRPFSKWESAAMYDRFLGYSDGTLAAQGRVMKTIISAALRGWENLPEAGEFETGSDGCPTEEALDRFVDAIGPPTALVYEIYSRNRLGASDQKN